MAEEETTESTEENAGGGVTIDESGKGVKEGEKKSDRGVGGKGEDEETRLTILTGRKMEWFFDKSSGKWYVSYGLPGKDEERSLLFEASPEQMDALFGPDMRPTEFKRRSLERLTRSRNVTFGGNIAEMEGKGRFEDEVRRVKALALDNGVLPEWAEKTGEVMNIIYIAQAEGKSGDWMLNEISRTQGFKERFPGIKRIKEAGNLTLEEAITGFLEFEAGVKAAVTGIGGKPGRVTPEVVGGLLKRGHSLDTVVSGVAKFDRMKAYRPAMQAFNKVLEANGMEPIRKLQDMFDFVAGKAPADVYEIWEASSVSEAAAAAGLGDIFTAEDAMKFAAETEGQTSLGDATQGFQEAANLLLRLRHEVDVGRFGLDQDDIIDLSLGRAPRSGTSGADLTENMNRAILSAQGNLKGRAKPFKGFSQTGTSQDASLGGLRSR